MYLETPSIKKFSLVGCSFQHNYVPHLLLILAAFNKIAQNLNAAQMMARDYIFHNSTDYVFVI